MYKTKKLLLFPLLLLLLFTLTACSGKSDSKTKNTAKNKKAPECLRELANALSDEDYEKIFSMLHVSESDPITQKDLEEYLKTSTIQGFLGSNKIEVGKAKENTAFVSAELTSYGESFRADFQVNEAGQPILLMNNFIVTNELIAPSGCTVKINGTEIPKDLATDSSNIDKVFKNEIGYTVKMPNSDTTATVESEFCSYDVTLPKMERDADYVQKYYLYDHNIPEAEMEEALQSIMALLNTGIQSCDASDTPSMSDVQDIYASDADSSEIDNFVSWYDNTCKEKNVTITDIKPDENQEFTTILTSENTLHVFCKIKSLYDGSKEGTEHVEAMLKYENGQYFFYYFRMGGFLTNPFNAESY